MIIGFGSIGKKHAKLLKNFKNISEIYILTKQNCGNFRKIKHISEVNNINPDYILICSRTTDHFKHLSSHLINAVQLFGINEKVYVEFCPMADNNNGAYWLSKEEKVINPYFGEAMLTCGEVKQVIE